MYVDLKKEELSLIIHSTLALQPYVGASLHYFGFLIVSSTYGGTPWRSDQLVARPVPTQGNTR
jgi:hypothetical protein